MVDLILGKVFPNFCAGCAKQISFLALVCDSCESSMRGPMTFHYKLPYVDRAYSYWWYDPPFSEIIKQYKFSGRHRLSKYFAELVFKTMITLSLDVEVPIVPVPTTPEAIRRRGFDTNRMILSSLNKKLDVSVVEILTTRGMRQQQSSLGMEERKENVRGSFVIVNNRLPDRVILFDDVVTSGSTIRECAKTLKDNGTSEVTLVSLARSKP